MKVLVAQAHHVSESSHSPCQRNNYAIKYHLFLFSSSIMIVCTCAVFRGLSHPPGIRAISPYSTADSTQRPSNPTQWQRFDAILRLRKALTPVMDLDTTRLVPKGLIRFSPRVQRDGCAGNRPFRRQNGGESSSAERRGWTKAVCMARGAAGQRTVPYGVFNFEQVFRRPYVRKTGGKPLRIRVSSRHGAAVAKRRQYVSAIVPNRCVVRGLVPFQEPIDPRRAARTTMTRRVSPGVVRLARCGELVWRGRKRLLSKLLRTVLYGSR
ncbi:hypothetical protein BGY98DRAFT_964450 [Russula aff. rugulosa BPL654]|nr:hypothetical protein BGY98DRAFT_964450 [Russula aff. rugulosa BPL654]